MIKGLVWREVSIPLSDGGCSVYKSSPQTVHLVHAARPHSSFYHRQTFSFCCSKSLITIYCGLWKWNYWQAVCCQSRQQIAQSWMAHIRGRLSWNFWLSRPKLHLVAFSTPQQNILKCQPVTGRWEARRQTASLIFAAKWWLFFAKVLSFISSAWTRWWVRE